jgi:hypothetical protein
MPFQGHAPVHLVAVECPGQPGLSYLDGYGHANVLGVIPSDSSEGVITAPTPTRFSSGSQRLVLQALNHAGHPIRFGESLVPRLTMAYAAPSTVLSNSWERMIREKRLQMLALGAGGASGYEMEY